MKLHQPKSLDEIKKSAKEIRNVNIIHKQKLSKLDKIALWITDHVGSMGFFIIILVWTAIWLGWNTLSHQHPGSTLSLLSFSGSLFRI